MSTPYPGLDRHYRLNDVHHGNVASLEAPRLHRYLSGLVKHDR